MLLILIACLKNAGVAVENGVIQVNEISQTNVENIYAIGDVTDRMNLTPVALMEAMAFVKTLFGGEKTSPDYSYVPSAVFCQPPLATVILELKEKQELDSVGWVSRGRSHTDILRRVGCLSVKLSCHGLFQLVDSLNNFRLGFRKTLYVVELRKH